MDSSEPLPLMEGEGRSFRVLGFNQNQRAAFVQILMRFLLTFLLFFIFSIFAASSLLFLSLTCEYLSLVDILVPVREVVPMFVFSVFTIFLRFDLLNTGLGLGILTGRSSLLG